MRDNAKLLEWQEKYQRSRRTYEELDKFKERQEQYDGSKTLGMGQKPASVVWNFTQELIESQIDSSVPRPKVTPMRPTEKTLKNARTIQDMLMAQVDRLPFEAINDEDERACKIMGGSGYLVEWDNGVKTHDTVGDVSVRSLGAAQIIPRRRCTRPGTWITSL